MARGMTRAGLLPRLWLRDPAPDTWLPRAGDTCVLREATLPNPSCHGPELRAPSGGWPGWPWPGPGPACLLT